MACRARGAVERRCGPTCSCATTSTSTCDKRIRRPARSPIQSPDATSICRWSPTRPMGSCRATTPAARSPARYRFGRTLDVGAQLHPLAGVWGNFDAETVAGGPTPFDYRYPEYKQESWNFPDGDLAVDQRHRARFWVNYSPDFAPGLTVSVLQALESGVPYGAVEYQRAQCPTVRHQPGLSVASWIDGHDLLLRSARRVPHRGSEAYATWPSTTRVRFQV